MQISTICKSAIYVEMSVVLCVEMMVQFGAVRRDRKKKQLKSNSWKHVLMMVYWWEELCLVILLLCLYGLSRHLHLPGVLSVT